MLPEPGTVILVVIGGVIGLIYLGLVIYRAGTRDSSGTSITIPSVGTNDSSVACTEACLQFNQRRQERCSAAFAEAAAKTDMEARRTDFFAAVSALGVVIAAAIAAAAGLPWPANLIVSLVFWTAATILTGVMIFMLGKLNAASGRWAAASTALMDANTKVMEARGIVNTKCSLAEATACLTTPNPC